MKAYYAGIIIGLGAVVNLAVGGGILGAALFSFALLMICALELDLFTGKVGATLLGEYSIVKLLLSYILNALGIATVGIICCFSPIAHLLQEQALIISNLRVSNHWLTNIMMGIFCGICVQLAVDGWKATKNPLPVMLPVIVFVMSKANHCIADMFYLIFAQRHPAFLTLLYTTIGNIIGAALMVAGRLWQGRNLRIHVRATLPGAYDNKQKTRHASKDSHPPHNKS